MGVAAGVTLVKFVWSIVLGDNFSKITTSALRNYLLFLFIKSSGDFRLQNCNNNI